MAINSLYPGVHNMTSRFYQFQLILPRTLYHFLIVFQIFNPNNSGTKKDIEKRYKTAIFLIFNGLSDRTIKFLRHWHCKGFSFSAVLVFRCTKYIADLLDLLGTFKFRENNYALFGTLNINFVSYFLMVQIDRIQESNP